MNRFGHLPCRPVLLAAALLALLGGACTRPAPGPDRAAQLAALDPQERLAFAQFEREHLLRRDAQVLELGERLLATYPEHPLANEALAMMIASAARLPAADKTVALAAELVQRAPESEELAAVLLPAADALAAAQQPAAALRILAHLTAVLSDPDRRQAALARAPALVEQLSDSDLQQLLPPLAETPLASLLAAELADRQSGIVIEPAGPTGTRLGVLTPLTGRYARLGNAFLAGVRQAAQAVPPPPGETWRIMHEDSEGDVVAAALAAQRLIVEDDCQILIGSLLSATTAAAALVADRYGVPLVSPTAAHERLELLGELVLQTNRTGTLEATILARLACEVMLKRRFVVIHADTPESAELAVAFQTAVGQHGGSVLCVEVFDPAATDFRPQIERLRTFRPEVVYAQATVDQMILLGPQLDFYRLGALVIGPSEWNNARLLQSAGTVMERAIFPVGEVFFPAAWTAAFAAQWPSAQHDEEATRIARSAYLSTRMILEAMAGGMARAEARELVGRLRAGFRGRSVDLDAVESFSTLLRLVDGGQIVPFPGHLYAAALQRRPSAATVNDTTARQTPGGLPLWPLPAEAVVDSAAAPRLQPTR